MNGKRERPTRFFPIEMPAPLLAATAAVLLAAASCSAPGARGPAQGGESAGTEATTKAAPAAARETLSPVTPPAWFSAPPEASGGARYVPGTGTSTASAAEALSRAEQNAREEAARIAGSLVRSEWTQHTRGLAENGDIAVRERIDAVTRVFSEETLTRAAVIKRETFTGRRFEDGKEKGIYYQGFALLEVPEENFIVTAKRCIEKAHALFTRGRRQEALSVAEGASLRWPEDRELLARLADMEEECGRLGDALHTLKKLRGQAPAAERARIGKEIERLEKEFAGGEYGFLLKRLRKILPATENPNRLKLTPLADHAPAGGTIDYTVLTDRPYFYYGIWVDDEGIFLYPAHAADSGTRLGNDEGAAAVSLDAGATPGPHLFVLVAAKERAAWFAARSFPRDKVDRRAADGRGRLYHRDLAAIIDDIEERAAAGTLATASFSFQVAR